MGSVTTYKSYQAPTVNGDNLTWGQELQNFLTLADLNMGGVVSVSVAGNANVVASTTSYNTLNAMTPGSASFMMQKLIGALTGNIQYQLPAVSGFYIVQNGTTGNYTITLATVTGGSTGIILPFGSTIMVCSDGTNVYEVSSGVTLIPPQAATGTSDAILCPTVGMSYQDGQVAIVTATAANITTSPTLNGLTITKWGGQALIAGDISGAGHRMLLALVGTGARYELLNPASPFPYTVGTAANNLLQTNGSNQLPAVDGSLIYNLPSVGGIPLTWSTVTINTVMTTRNGYVANASNYVNFQTPPLGAIGDPIVLSANGSGGWVLTPSVGQTIIFGGNGSAVGIESLFGSQNATVRLTCVVANLVWQVESFIGTISLGYNGDAFWNEVSCQLMLNGGIADSSGNNLVFTNTNTVTASTAQNKFLPYSALFNGTNQYLNITTAKSAFQFSGEVTLEGWFFPTAFNGTANATLFDTRLSTSSTTGLWLYTTQTNGYLTLWLNNGTLITTTSVLPNGSWSHVAVTRNGKPGTNGTWTIWVNGLAIGAASSSLNVSDGWMSIGGSVSGGNYYAGYISQFRVTNGICRYAASFSAPTVALLTSQDVTADMAWNRTVAQFGFQNVLTDSSGNGLTMTNSGAVAFSGTIYKVGVASAAFSSSYLYNASTTALQTTGDFTYEAWVYPTANGASGGSMIVTAGLSGSQAGIMLTASALTVACVIGGSTVITTAALTASQWSHVAFVRSGQTVTAYVNGSVSGTPTTNTSAIASTGIYIGGSTTANTGFAGNMNNVRVSNFARYTAPFTPSVLNFQTALPLAYDPFWRDTVFLPRAATGNTGSDVSGNGLALTLNSTISQGYVTTQDPYCWLFNGSSNNIVPSSPGGASQFAGDLTFECWAYLNAYGASGATGTATSGSCLIDTRASGASATGFALAIVNTTGQFAFNTNGIWTCSTMTATLNSWTHVALVRLGSTITVYVGGVAQFTVTSTANFSDTNLTIGSTTAAVGAALYMSGYLSGIRLAKAARYAASYTPPSSPFQITGPM